MPFRSGKFRAHIVPHHLDRQFRADHARPQAQHVHIVILHTLPRREAVVAGRRADPLDLVRRHASAPRRCPQISIARSARPLSTASDTAFA